MKATLGNRSFAHDRQSCVLTASMPAAVPDRDGRTGQTSSCTGRWGGDSNRLADRMAVRDTYLCLLWVSAILTPRMIVSSKKSSADSCVRACSPAIPQLRENLKGSAHTEGLGGGGGRGETWPPPRAWASSRRGAASEVRCRPQGNEEGAGVDTWDSWAGF